MNMANYMAGLQRHQSIICDTFYSEDQLFGLKIQLRCLKGNSDTWRNGEAMGAMEGMDLVYIKHRMDINSKQPNMVFDND